VNPSSSARLTFCCSILVLGVLWGAGHADCPQVPGRGAAQNDTRPTGFIGNEACAKCHAPIYETYMRTAMAHASGPAEENLISGEFVHRPSRVRYAVYRDRSKVWLSFDRPGDPLVDGKRELLYYIGQGRRGRTYLFSVDGYLFESPVNWYADRQMWDMAPAHGDDKHIPLNLAATTSCLDCHVSGVRAPLNGSENRYPEPVFFFSGVTCERCHGPGESHANGGPIINPGKLPPNLRDQVCMQCHLEGNAAIERPGKHLYEYTAGKDLSDYIRYFVLMGNVPQGLRATSQFEALEESACKRKTGESMSCMSCHDPHQAVPPEERVAFYRSKCIACHGEAFAAKHHSKQKDCAACHMPASLSTDVAHTQVTDHRIPRSPRAEGASGSGSNVLPVLVAFPPSLNTAKQPREFALAWQTIADGGMTMAQAQAERLVRAALSESPNDAALLSALAFSVQRHGDDIQASALYKRALDQDPTLVDASTNLGVLEAKQGHVAEAVRLWRSAFERAPGRSEIGMNLALVFCQGADYRDAREYVVRVLRFNPDLGPAKKLIGELNANPPSCGL